MTAPFTPYALGLAASLATLAGGILALRLRPAPGPVLALCAGIVIGVALLDLLPEALRLRDETAPVLLALAAGAALFAFAGRVLPRAGGGGRALRRHLGPASLTLHSLLDGAGIGLAFHVSPTTGWSVTAAVLTHDLADGVNVVGLSLAAGGGGSAWRWLLLNALAPLAGVALGQVLRPSPALLGLLLALIAGVFLSLGATELLPRSLRANRRGVALATAACGLALVGAWVHAGA